MALELEDPQGATLFGMTPESARAELESSVAAAAKKFGFSVQDERPAVIPGETVQETDLDVLRRLLADQQLATLQARAETAVLHELLARAQPPPSEEIKIEEAKARLRPDAVLIKAQWERTQKDLQRALVSHQRASAQATAKLAKVSEALETANAARSQETVRLKREFLLKTVVGLTVSLIVLAIGFLTVTFWPRLKFSLPSEPSAATPFQTVQAPLVLDPALPSQPAPANAAKESQPHSEFSQDLGRLSRAFDRFPGVAPEAVMRAVNQKGVPTGSLPCAFEWNRGEPALQFGDGHGGNRSLASSITRCADAVERYH